MVSPVSGEVTGVKYYRLYGKYDDVQIDIRPKGASDVLVSLLLVSNPRVSIGDSVERQVKTVLGTVKSTFKNWPSGWPPSPVKTVPTFICRSHRAQAPSSSSHPSCKGLGNGRSG